MFEAELLFFAGHVLSFHYRKLIECSENAKGNSKATVELGSRGVVSEETSMPRW